MSAVSVVGVIALLAVGFYGGSIAFLSFVLAPMVFKTLDAQAASTFLRALFPRYYWFGIVCCAIALLSSLVLFWLAPSTSASTLAVATGALCVSNVYALMLVPRINEARDQKHTAVFRALHLRSVVLNGANLLIVIIAFILTLRVVA